MRYIRKIAFSLCVLLSLPACSQSASSPQSDTQKLQELQAEANEVFQLIDYFCANIYPKLAPIECLNRVKHGIGNSFDLHSQYMDKKEIAEFQNETSGAGFVGIGIEVAKASGPSPVIVVSAIEGTPAEKAGLRPDDAIMAFSNDGKPFVSTLSLSTEQAVKSIRGEHGTTIVLRVRRVGVAEELTIPILRDTIKIAQISGELLSANGKVYALIRSKVYQENNARALKAKFEELQAEARGKLSGLIISSENNPGGLLHEVAGGVDLFLDTESIVLLRDNKSISRYDDPRILRTKGDITNGLPILVVVNSMCASACEVFAGNMKFHHRALIAGTAPTTFGKGIVQTVTRAPLGGAIKYTSSEYLVGNVENWIPVQCIGVNPDVVFSYPGVKEPKRISECELSQHVFSLGPMPNAPTFRTLEEVNPAHYRVGLEMLDAYKAKMLPKVLSDQARRKAMIESQKKESE